MFHAAQGIILPLKKGQLALQFPIVDHTPLIQSGALDRTAWFGGVGAIPKSAVPRQKLNIVKAGVKLIGISPEVQLAQAGQVHQQPAFWHQEQLPARGYVAPTLVVSAHRICALPFFSQ